MNATLRTGIKFHDILFSTICCSFANIFKKPFKIGRCQSSISQFIHLRCHCLTLFWFSATIIKQLGNAGLFPVDLK